VAAEALRTPEEEKGWTVVATTVGAEVCSDAEMLEASQAPPTTVEPGFRWIKHPAALSPVWREKPERSAALARRTVLGGLVSTGLQRQVRLDRRRHGQQLPGHNGERATPTAAVVLALLAPVAVAHLRLGHAERHQV
jgi:hypothetical protein